MKSLLIFVIISTYLISFAISQNVTNSTVADSGDSPFTGMSWQEIFVMVLPWALVAISEFLALPFMKKYVDSNGILHFLAYTLLPAFIKFFQKQNAGAKILAAPTA